MEIEFPAATVVFQVVQFAVLTDVIAMPVSSVGQRTFAANQVMWHVDRAVCHLAVCVAATTVTTASQIMSASSLRQDLVQNAALQAAHAQ